MKIKPEHIAVAKSYLRAVLASAITLAISLSINLDPQYAILVGAIAGPLAKWADKTEVEFGRFTKK